MTNQLSAKLSAPRTNKIPKFKIGDEVVDSEDNSDGGVILDVEPPIYRIKHRPSGIVSHISIAKIDSWYELSSNSRIDRLLEKYNGNI